MTNQFNTAGQRVHRLGVQPRKIGVDLASDVALDAADDLAFAEAFGGAAFDFVAGGSVVAIRTTAMM